jgi:hypothetical protein
VFNPIELKLQTILTPIAERLGYFEPENIRSDKGVKLSKVPFILKICGDGTNIGKSYLNLFFTLELINYTFNNIYRQSSQALEFQFHGYKRYEVL